MTGRERVAIVTGGARGIGRAIAARLLADGHRVVIADIDLTAAAATAGALGPSVTALHCDVTDSGSVNRMVAEVMTRFGRLDVLVNNAGITGSKAFTELTDQDWSSMLAINLNGPFYCSRAAVPHMLAGGWGRIVNIASIAGKEGNAQMAPYSASKAGVIGLTKSLGKELAETPVRVNCVTPALIATDMMEDISPAALAGLLARIPMGRVGQPQEVAELVAWLASDACSFSTGAVFDISGGRATY